MKQEISISAGTMVKALVIGLAAFVLWELRDLALLIVSAVVLASAIEPGVAFFVKYRIPRPVAVVGIYMAVFSVIFGIFYVFIPPVLDDSQNFLRSVPQYLDTLNLPDSVITEGEQRPETEGTAKTILADLYLFRNAFDDPWQGAVRLVASSFGGIFSLALVIVLSIYFAILDTGVEDFLRLVTPSKYEDYVTNLWNRARRKIGLWMQGQLLLSLIVGILVYPVLLILGVPYALLLAVLASIFDLIPVFGSPFAGLIAVIVAFSSGGLTVALIVAALYFVVNQVEANFLYPLVVKYVTGIPPLMVILSLIIGGSLAGFVGVLLSVPVAATLRELLNDVEKGKLAARIAKT